MDSAATKEVTLIQVNRAEGGRASPPMGRQSHGAKGGKRLPMLQPHSKKRRGSKWKRPHLNSKRKRVTSGYDNFTHSTSRQKWVIYWVHPVIEYMGSCMNIILRKKKSRSRYP
jgi:hypothetical protein